MRNLISILIAFIALIFIVSSCKKEKLGPADPTVLVMGAESHPAWIVDVKNKLDSTFMFSVVDTFNMQTKMPTLYLLKEYDAVLVFTDNSPIDAIGIGDIIAEYIEAGGGVVNATFAGNVPILGAFTQYALYTQTSQSSGITLSIGDIFINNHPTLENVNSFNGGNSSFHNTDGILDAGAYVVANYSNGQPLIIAKENVGPENVNRVFLNIFPPSINARIDFWDTSTDGAMLMAQSLLWVID